MEAAEAKTTEDGGSEMEQVSYFYLTIYYKNTNT